MKIQKAELAQKLNKIKGVVPKKTSLPALQGALVRDGYLIANNLEMAVKAKIEGTEGESFLIPERAFDLINNLPDGDVEIFSASNNIIYIRADKIENKYQTMEPEQFPIMEIPKEGSELSIKADTLLESLKRVSYAVLSGGNNHLMSSVCMQATEGHLNFVGLDGHVLAWDKIDYDGEFELLIPKNTADKLKSIGMSGEVSITYNKTGAVFATEEFEIYTRLIEGKYFNYQKMFAEFPLHTKLSRLELLDAMTRAKLCTEEKSPVKFELDERCLKLNIKDRITDYHETINLQEEWGAPFTIGFDARLVLESLKAFDCENIRIYFNSPKTPMVIHAENCEFKGMVLPVMIK